MSYDELLAAVELAANGGAIIAGVSTFAIALSLVGRRSREKRALETYLKRMTADRQRNGEQGLENILEVMRWTKLGEEAVMHAAFSSKKVRVRSRLNERRQTMELVIGYGDHDKG